MVVGQDPTVTLIFLHVRLMRGILGILLGLSGIVIYCLRAALTLMVERRCFS